MILLVKYRDRVEIVVDILNAASQGAKKTRIMYVANLSYRLLEKYLGETIRMGFLFFGSNGYEVTEKGRSFLEKYEEFSSKYSRVASDMKNMLSERRALEKLCEPEINMNSKQGTRRGR
jgi:predicted transcriptional regulator